MANVPSTAQIIDQLHQEFLPARETLFKGTSEKASVGRSFKQYFRGFPVHLQEYAGRGPDEATMQELVRIVRNARDRQRMIDDMRARVAEVLQPLSASYVLGLNDHFDANPKFTTFREAFYQRLMDLRNVQFHGFDPEDPPEERERLKRISIQETSLSFGCSNVAHVTFSQLDVLPRVFQAEHGRLPDEAEFQGMVASLPRLMQLLARTHDEIHEVLIDALRGPQWCFDRESPCFWAPYQQDSFRLDGLRLEIHPNIIEPTRRMIRERIENGGFKTGDPRVGCPAHQIIPPIHQWCLQTARVAFFDNMDLLMELQDDRRKEIAMENVGAWSRFL